MLEHYKIKIDTALAALEFPEQPADLYDPIRYILQIGGKRIRPMLVLLAADVFDEEGASRAMGAALAIELFHNFTLMHDDIMDEAPLRRGMQTVHQKWNQSVAILAGDKLMVRAYHELSQTDPNKLPELLRVFNQVAREVCEGQQWDMQYEEETMVTEDEYLSMIRLKTAVLLGGALKMGAILADASEHDAECLYEFGIAVGIAFQLQDDILDVYGEAAEVGKQIGGDILANKKTILLVQAFRLADDRGQEELNRFLQMDGFRDSSSASEKIESVRALYDRLGVDVVAKKRMEGFVENAFRKLDQMQVDQKRLTELRRLAQSLLTRTN